MTDIDTFRNTNGQINTLNHTLRNRQMWLKLSLQKTIAIQLEHQLTAVWLEATQFTLTQLWTTFMQ